MLYEVITDAVALWGVGGALAVRWTVACRVRFSVPDRSRITSYNVCYTKLLRYLDQGEGDLPFYRAKLASARFYADQMLPQAIAFAETVKTGDAAIAGLGDELFDV